MAVGVPEIEVFAAADAVLARGERPTVERVRLELGRGSPARVGALLDQWWEQLAERLRGETRLPGLPAEVAQAFVVVWQQATTLAQGLAEQALAGQRQALVAEREELAAREERMRLEASQDRQQTADALAAHQVAETRLADLEQLLAQRQTQIEDLQRQREGLFREHGESRLYNQELQQDLRTTRLKAEQERVALEVYVRGVEDRAHCEVDHAREEGKATTIQLKVAKRQAEQSQQRLESIKTELSQAQQRAAAQQARAETLEQQLTQLRQKPVSKRKSRTRKTVIGSDPASVRGSS